MIDSRPDDDRVTPARQHQSPIYGGMQIYDTTRPACLFRADGSPTGFTITVIGNPGPQLRIRIDRP